MKLLLIYHDTSCLPERVKRLVRNTQGRKITVEVVHDVDFLIADKHDLKEYNAILLDYGSIPYEFLVEFASHFFPDNLVLVISQDTCDIPECGRIKVVPPKPDVILETICVENEIPILKDKVKIVMRSLDLIEQGLQNYVNQNNPTKS